LKIGYRAEYRHIYAAHNRRMLDAVVNAPQITNLLTLLGPAGAILGGVAGWFFEATNWRRAFENLALGATAGTVCFSAAAFLAYALIRFFWLVECRQWRTFSG
jgi:hypothetical protein